MAVARPPSPTTAAIDRAPNEVPADVWAVPDNPLIRPWVLVVVALLIAAGAGLLGWLAAPRPPGDDSAEAGFARDMRRHHAQAVEMALLLRDRTDDVRMRTLATDIILTQQNQIGQMLGWLDVWGLPVTGANHTMAWMGHPEGTDMPGMAPPEEIAHLQSLTGVEADAEFLRLMIRHHEGAVPMANAILERTDREAVERLARSILASQQAEIDLMQELLAAKTAAPPA